MKKIFDMAASLDKNYGIQMVSIAAGPSGIPIVYATDPSLAEFFGMHLLCLN
jgi:hypothetical protein